MGYIMKNGVAYGAGITPIVLIGTLLAGETTITFTNEGIAEEERYNFYTWNKPNCKPTNVSINNHTLTLTYPAQATDTQIKVVINENVNTAVVNGDISNYNVDFIEADTRENVVAEESLSILFGKVQKWFSDLEAGAFVNTGWSESVDCLVGDTTCTILDDRIVETSIIEPFVETASGKSVTCTTITITTGQAVLAFNALTEAATMMVRITNR
jgi:hypothetical protein